MIGSVVFFLLAVCIYSLFVVVCWLGLWCVASWLLVLVVCLLFVEIGV